MEDSKKLRIVFMGTSRFAARILGALLQAGYEVISVYTQSTRKEVSEIAKTKGIKILNPKIFDALAEKELKLSKPDLLIVASYGKILPKNILEIPTFKALNVHPSYLPKFRGPSPLQNAILAGEKETGTTIMLMNEKIDEGDIFSQEKIKIGGKETYEELLEKSAAISSALLLKTIPLWIGKKIKPEKQDESRATYCQLIERSDGKINWGDSAREIYDRWRSLTPWPGIYTFFETKNGYKRLKIIAIGYDPYFKDDKKNIGEVFEYNDKIYVLAGAGAIILKFVQPESKSETDIKSFINGHKKFLNSILK